MTSVTLPGVGVTLRPSVFLHPLGVWLLMAAAAVANGVFRELVLVPRIGDRLGHLVSTGLLVAILLAISYGYFATTSIEYRLAEAVLVGILWTLLTVGFEFLVGYLEGTPVSVTVSQYDVLAGQVWILVPLTLLAAPVVFGWYLS